MGPPAAVISHLHDLIASVEADVDLVESLAELVGHLRSTAASYSGLRLTMMADSSPITLTAFSAADHQPVTTSLRLLLSALDPGLDSGSRVIFYAEAPGAFVDLAADLSHALGAPVAQHRGLEQDGHIGVERDGSLPPRIELDADLPPLSRVSGLSGVTEFSTVNRAVGAMIEQGADPGKAHAILYRHAAAAGLEPHVYAAWFLDRPDQR